jgi:O-antigen ligase
MTELLARIGPRAFVPIMVFVALGLGAATAMSPPLGIAGCVAILSLFGMTYSAGFALAAYVFVTYFEVLSSQGIASPVKIAGILLVVLAMTSAAVRFRSRDAAPGALGASPIIVFALLSYTAMSFASGGWDSSSLLWKLKAQMLLSNVVVFLAMVSLLRTTSYQRVVGWAALLGATVSTLYGFATGAELAGRSIGGFGDPNEFATVLIASISLGYGALVAASRRRVKFVAFACMAVCFSGIISSQSRGGLIGLVAMLVVIVVTARGRERTRLVGIAMIALAVFGAVFASSIGAGLRERVNDEGSSGRSNLWRIAVAIWKDHPVAGVGTGSFSVMVPRYLTPEHTTAGRIQTHGEVAHNVYLETLAELGTIGVTAFLFLLGGITLRLYRSIRVARRMQNELLATTGRSIFAALIGVFICDTFLSGQYQEMLWIVLGCALAHSQVVRVMDRRPVRQQDHEIVEVLPYLVPDEDVLDATFTPQKEVVA